MTIDIDGIRRILRKNFSKQELLEVASSIYPLHRIQGSSELEKAIDIVASYLSKLGIPYRIYEYSYSQSYGLQVPVIGWDVKYGEARLVKPIDEVLSSFAQSKTAVVAHSPPGEVEAEVVYVPSPEHLEKIDVRGKIVLSSSSPRSLYFKACDRGAKAFLFFRKSAPSDAVPYMGLFLKPSEANKASAPAVSIPRRHAQKIIDYLEKGVEVVARVRVEASFRDDARIRVLEAWIGEGSEEIHAVAHICHPGGTVNDNVSGCSTLLEIAASIKRSIDSGELELPRNGRAVFVWLPEYSGTVPYLMNVLNSRRVSFTIDLDMVGEKQFLTGSTLVFIRSPSILRSPMEAVLYSILLSELRGAKTFGNVSSLLEYRFDLSPYLRGSDHDIYLKFGVPAIMLNQWPDRFYHTDMDTIDKLDPEICKRVGVAVGTAMYAATLLGTRALLEELRPAVEGYELIVKGLRGVTLARKKREGSSSNKDARYRCRAVGLPGRRYLEEVLSEDDLKRIEKLSEENGLYANLFFGYIPIVLSAREMSFDELAELIEDEYGVVDRKKLAEILDLLTKARVIERVQ
ncbi:MAG: DUF4910 domain-containing protein [Crenarchaeota archaeon]|nr:DUF4910 domain-containing protein [Thermoproteota archaeon]